MPRIVTMIASATEIVCALGMESDLVPRSHECDYPHSVKRLPVCTAPRFDVHGTSLDIDQRVKSLLGEAGSIYQVDAAMLEALAPDVIITQGHCEVCAVSEKDVASALVTMASRRTPLVVSLSPSNLADVWTSIRNVASALGVESRGTEVVQRLQTRVDSIAGAFGRTDLQSVPAGDGGRIANPSYRPAVACLEWTDPLMAAGNWVPELVQLAGGQNLFGSAGKHSPWMTWEQLCAVDPDIIIAMPCGFDLAKTRIEMASLSQRREWRDLKAVRSRQVYITDGNQYFNRPGPRLVESLEILAEVFHPPTFQFGHEGTGWAKYPSV